MNVHPGAPIDPDDVVRRLVEVRDRIRSAGGGPDVAILAVTKGFGGDAIDAAVAAGCTSVGENYAQELIAKRDTLSVHSAVLDVHFIGQLQTNKVRTLAGLVDLYETVDRASLVAELARRQPGARVLVQVGTGDEHGKGGCRIDDVDELVARATDAGLDVRGLMAVGPTDGGPEAARPGFARVRAMVDRLDLDVCSMGMSADLEVAVAEGSTEIRVGTALFGPRPDRERDDR